MSGLQEFPVTVIHRVSDTVTANVQALLAEISDMLAALLTKQQSGTIDLRSLPLLPGELEAIKTILGEGEVRATFEALGPSIIYETALGGVWWVSHQNENGDVIAEYIEVTQFPEILKSKPAEIDVAQTALQQQLQEWIETAVINKE